MDRRLLVGQLIHLNPVQILASSGASVTDWVTAVATGVSATAVLVGAVYAGRQLRRSSQSHHLQAMARVTDLVAAPDVMRARDWLGSNAEMVRRSSWSSIPVEGRKNIETILRAWDRVGLLLEHGLVEDSRPLFDMWAFTIQSTYADLAHLLDQRRQSRGNPRFGHNFENLYKMVRSYSEEVRENDRYFILPSQERLGDGLRRKVAARTYGFLDRNPPQPPRRRRNARAWQTFSRPLRRREARRGLPVKLYGLTYVWNEGDVIWATVRNLFDQGADEVFVIDDGSTDETREEAAAAGATLKPGPGSRSFSEEARTTFIQTFIEDHTPDPGDNDNDVWWIVVDADEFPRGPKGARVKDFVSQLPYWVDVVGSRVLEHVPKKGSTYDPHRHPAHNLPLAYWYYDPYCRRRRLKRRSHWKHQLFRVREKGEVFPAGGRHLVGTASGRRAREARESLLMHHAPLRDFDRTEQRLVAQNSGGGRYQTSPTRFTKGRPSFKLSRLRDLKDPMDELVRPKRIWLKPWKWMELVETPNEFARAKRIWLKPRKWTELVDPSEGMLAELIRPDGLEGTPGPSRAGHRSGAASGSGPQDPRRGWSARGGGDLEEVVRAEGGNEAS